MKKLAFIFLFLPAVVLFSTCRKAEENNFMKGTWRITDCKMNKDTADALRLFLPGYTGNGNCCDYELDFAENKTVIATYTFQDTLAYTKEGEWELVKKDEMHLYLDMFINATFKLTKLDDDNYTFASNSDSNYVEALDSIVKLTLKFKRNTN